MASCSVCFAQTYPPNNSFYYVANTHPPDAYLSLRTEPTTSHGMNIMTMPNGTLLELIERRFDRWWHVRVFPTGQEGWALSAEGNKVWIECCVTAHGAPAADENHKPRSASKHPQTTSTASSMKEFAEKFQAIFDVTSRRATLPCHPNLQTATLSGAMHMQFSKKTAQENCSATEIPR